MTLEQLRIFLAVAERQHVTRAAEALNLTQSAVSSAIAALEGRHGVALFDRVGRSIVLNKAGQAFEVEARAVLARARAAEAALQSLGDLSRGRVAIHASQTIASYWLPPKLAEFHRAYPGIGLDVRIGNTAAVARSVADGAAEIGLVEGSTDLPELEKAIVDQDQLGVFVGRDHPWAKSPGRKARDPKSTAWVVREDGSGTRASFEQALAEHGLSLAELEVALVLPGNEAVRSAVEAGAGAAAMSRSAAAAGLASGALVEIPFELAPRAFYALRHKQRYRSKASDVLMDLIRKTVKARKA